MISLKSMLQLHRKCGHQIASVFSGRSLERKQQFAVYLVPALLVTGQLSGMVATSIMTSEVLLPNHPKSSSKKSLLEVCAKIPNEQPDLRPRHHESIQAVQRLPFVQKYIEVFCEIFTSVVRTSGDIFVIFGLTNIQI